MRIQILHLPGAGDDYPFAIVIDEAPHADSETVEQLQTFKDAAGARAVLVTPETVEVL